MRPSFHPRLVNGPFEDPGLFIPLLGAKQAMLFDLGDLSTLSPRDILKLSHIFVSHTHMDHFVGFDQVVRLTLGRRKTLYLYGPYGFLNNVTGKLNAYTWNLVKHYHYPFVLKASEICDNEIHTQTFACRQGFQPTGRSTCPRSSSQIYQDPALTVQTEILDHKIPCLGFVMTERFHINILKSRLEEMDLEVGPWISQLKQLLYSKADPATIIQIPGVQPRTYTLDALAKQIIHISPGQKVAYITDAAYTPENEAKIIRLAQHADHLFIEAAFLHQDQDTAREKHHLTAYQAGAIAHKAKVKQITVFHHSPRYEGQGHLFEEEARQAFEGRD